MGRVGGVTCEDPRIQYYSGSARIGPQSSLGYTMARIQHRAGHVADAASHTAAHCHSHRSNRYSTHSRHLTYSRHTHFRARAVAAARRHVHSSRLHARLRACIHSRDASALVGVKYATAAASHRPRYQDTDGATAAAAAAAARGAHGVGVERQRQQQRQGKRHRRRHQRRQLRMGAVARDRPMSATDPDSGNRW